MLAIRKGPPGPMVATIRLTDGSAVPLKRTGCPMKKRLPSRGPEAAPTNGLARGEGCFNRSKRCRATCWIRQGRRRAKTCNLAARFGKDEREHVAGFAHVSIPKAVEITGPAFVSRQAGPIITALPRSAFVCTNQFMQPRRPFTQLVVGLTIADEDGCRQDRWWGLGIHMEHGRWHP